MKKNRVLVNSWLNRGYIKEVRNAFDNYALLNKLHKKNRVFPLRDVAQTKKGRALILGSGSSLDDMIPQLKRWKGAIFCSSSQIDTLIYHGIDPDYLVHVEPFSDKEQKATPELSVPKNKRWGKTILIGHPSMTHGYLKQWSSEAANPSLMFRMYIASMEWYNTILYYAFPWVESIVIPFLTVVPAMLSVACTMGYDPLYLIGVDHGGNRFVKHYYKSGKWHTDIDQHRENGGVMKTKEGVEVENPTLFMKKGTALELFADLYHGRAKSIYNLAPPTKSSVMEIPYCDPELPLSGKDPVYTEEVRKEALRNLELYLAFANMFLIPGNNGMGKGYTNAEVSTMRELKLAVKSKNAEFRKNRVYYKQLMAQSGMSIKEMAENGIFPDDGQAEAARHIDVDAITFVKRRKYMAEARRIKKLAAEQYKGLKYIRFY